MPAVLVFGSAGAGKTTFCKKMNEVKNYKLINIDPAQESDIEYDVDLCEYITVDDVMKELDFGPNGGLFRALEEMMDEFEEIENIKSLLSNYFCLIDCPGQIELFLHSDILLNFINRIKSLVNNKIAIVYLIESSNFDSNKLLYSSFCSTVCMYRFYLPMVYIMSKANQIKDKENIGVGEKHSIHDYITQSDSLGKSMCEFIDSNGTVNFVPLDYTNEESVNKLVMVLENILQVDEDKEVK